MNTRRMLIIASTTFYGMMASCTVTGETAPDASTPETTPADLSVSDLDAHDDAADLPIPEDVGPDVADVAGEDTSDTGTDADAQEDLGVTPDGGGGAEDVDDPCATPLAINPSSLWAEPLQFAVFDVVGGSGERRFELEVDESGASIHARFGTFMAGPEPGAVIILVRDPVCNTEARAEVAVTPVLALLPETATIEPVLGRVQMEVVGGSGETELTIGVAGDPAAIPSSTLSSDGLLTAADAAEQLIITARDTRTGSLRTARVTVAAGSALRLDPAALVLPLGESWRLRALGGSGRLEVTVVPGAATTPEGQPTSAEIAVWEDGAFEALAEGRVIVRVSDRHTGEVVPFPIDVVAAAPIETNAAGDSRLSGQTLVTDLDGDGHPELILGVPEADGGGYDSGAVFIHRGVEGGFSIAPELTLTTDGRLDDTGAAVVVGDVTGDGLPDLIVGTPLSDIEGTDRGAVRVHAGVAGDLVDTSAALTLIGQTQFDQFGGALAVCDINGDGRQDLVVGARFAEDENASPIPANAGAIHLYLGTAVGLQTSPDQVIFGALPAEDGRLVGTAGLNLGFAMDAGDVDGDGRCDVAVSALAFSAGAGRSNDGAVFVYRGLGADAFGPGGLAAAPSLVLLSNETTAAGAQLGRSVAVGDLDGDGRAEVVAGAPEFNLRVGDSTRSGNGLVVIWPGDALPGEADPMRSTTDAPFRYVGRANLSETGDRFGYVVAIGDLDGQAPGDLFVTARLDEEAPYCISNCGTVHALAGLAGSLPDPSGPTHVYPGDANGQNFGSLLAVAPDFDGDGLAEIAGRAGTDSRTAPRLGLHFVRMSTLDTPAVELEQPHAPAGSRVGTALAVIPDIDGDGAPDLAVGAWRSQYEAASVQHRPGEVILLSGHARGGTTSVLQRIGGFAGHSTGDVFGHALAVVQNATTSGAPALAVVARLDDTGSACSPARTDTGAVHLFPFAEGGVETSPASVLWGPQAAQQIQSVTGADVNGDGVGDVIIGGTGWDIGSTSDNRGGIAVFFGQPLAGGGSPVHRCTPDFLGLGIAAGDVLGFALEPLGDLNGDGCDEIVASATQGDVPGFANAGLLHILWGFGAGCTFDAPMTTVMSPSNAAAQAGLSLSAADIDGDGKVELAVGGTRWNNGRETVGAVWLVEGSHLASLASSATPWEDGVRPAQIFNVAPAGVLPTRLPGERREENFGAGVALLAGIGFEDAWLAVGRPLGDMTGIDGAGGLSVFTVRLANGTFSIGAQPELAMGGETGRVRSGFAQRVIGWRTPSGRAFAVGAEFSSAVGLDDGAVFILPAR